MLGCMELSRLSQYSQSKRQQLFCLTTLGGQPVNWLNLSNVCLAQLRNFNDKLGSYRGVTSADSNNTATTTGEYSPCGLRPLYLLARCRKTQKLAVIICYS